MATLSAIPETHDILAYGGDTFILEVGVPAGASDGMVWNAEVRASKDATVVDAVLEITPPPVGGSVAYIKLLSADSSRLAAGGVVVQKRGEDGVVRAVQTYIGVYDCQISPPDGADPVTTLVKGSLSVELDVTRPVFP